MNRHQSSLVLLCLLAIGLIGSIASGSMPRDPISIRCDADLHKGNGILSGSGSATDPYVICDWAIEVQTGIGIEVRGISAYLVIRNCSIVGVGRMSTGILLREAPNTQVTDCKLTNLATGIFVYQDPDAFVAGNAITACRSGIQGSESSGISITANTIDGDAERGIFLWRCHDASITENVVVACTDGIYLDSCHRDSLTRNRVEASAHGIFLWDCFDCTAAHNVLRSCGLGLAVVHTSERNRIFGNIFLDNDRAATCDKPGNAWDGGYPVGGNFWAGEPFFDLLSGENQDQPGPDGIADKPRDIPLESLDRYPLMIRPSEDENT